VSELLDKPIKEIIDVLKNQGNQIEGELKQFISQLILSGDIYTIRQHYTPPILKHTDYEKNYKIKVNQAFLHVYEPFKEKQSLKAKLKIAVEALNECKDIFESSIELIYDDAPIKGNLRLSSSFIDKALEKIKEVE
jgi:hypothetical protein